MKARFQPYSLQFKQASGTSRGILHTKETFILTIEHEGKRGIGECALFRGLSCDDLPDYEEKLQWLCENINQNKAFIQKELIQYPSIIFGWEQAFLNLKHGGDLYFPSAFTTQNKAIKINGLIWMGSVDFMTEQIEDKLSKGFDCIKLKIGVDWPAEKKILKELRNRYNKNILEIRVDANGGFSVEQAKEVLNDLAELKIHSIEQPIKAGQIEDMQKLCATTPTSIALDEELIGIVNFEQKIKLLEEIRPQYIILKPALVGGFSSCDEWIGLAEKRNIG